MSFNFQVSVGERQSWFSEINKETCLDRVNLQLIRALERQGLDLASGDFVRNVGGAFQLLENFVKCCYINIQNLPSLAEVGYVWEVSIAPKCLHKAALNLEEHYYLGTDHGTFLSTENQSLSLAICQAILLLDQLFQREGASFKMAVAAPKLPRLSYSNA